MSAGKIYCRFLGEYIIIPDMRNGSQILVETTKLQKQALASVLKENGATLTEWFTDNIAEATADFSVEPIDIPHDLPSLESLADVAEVFNQLKRLDWAFSDDDTAYLSHDIHPYPAKFIPQIPRNLIARLSRRGETVWDPFGGSGTTALESVLLGRQAISSDLNPLAEVIGKAKLLTPTKEDDDFLTSVFEELFIVAASESSVVDALNRFVPLSQFTPDIPNCDQWFHPNAVAELSYVRARINTFQSEKCRRLASVCLSKIILKSSFQDSETRYARCQKDFPPGKVIRLFAGALESSLKKVRYLGTFLQFREARFLTADLRQGSVVKPGSVDLIVTSPPYANANDYHLYHRFRLFWIGCDPRELAKKEIGSHLRHQKEQTGIQEYLDEMEQCLKHMLHSLRPGRFAVMVVGDSLFAGKLSHTAGLLGGRAAKAGFEVVGEIERQLPKYRRSFISTARRLRSESLLVLRKPLELVKIRIFPPPYKLWPYEAEIRKTEINHLIGVHAEEELGNVLTARVSPLQIDKLRQLTFSHSFAASSIHEEPTWQAILENGDALKTSSRKDPKYVTHGIHAYKGKFYPQLARSLFNLAGLSTGQSILDPFCGSGTVPLEAYLNGFEGFGFDMNPLAVKIAKVKTEIVLVDPYLRDRLLALFQQRVAGLTASSELEMFPPDAMKEIESWFPAKVIRKLGVLLRAIRETPDVRVKEFLEVLLSNIVRQVSQQDPQDLRIRRREKPIEDAPVFELFLSHLAEQRERLSEFASRSNKAPCKFRAARIWQKDSRDPYSFSSVGIAKDTVNAVVTSPPYATALPYIDTDRLSILLLCGLPSAERTQIEESLTGSREIRNGDRRQLETAIENALLSDVPSLTARAIVTRVHRLNKNANVGFRRKNMAALLLRYFSDITKVFRNLDECLKPGAPAFFVIGDNLTTAGGQEVVIKSADVLTETAQFLGWNICKRIPITVTTENRRHAKHSITENDIIWCQKPD
jgi:DNA modification methylase